MSSKYNYTAEHLFSDCKTTWTIHNFTPKLLEAHSSFSELESPVIKMAMSSGCRRWHCWQSVDRYIKLKISKNRSTASLNLTFVDENGNYDPSSDYLKNASMKYEIGFQKYSTSGVYIPSKGESDFTTLNFRNSIQLGRLIDHSELIQNYASHTNELRIVVNLFYVEKHFEIAHLPLSIQSDAILNDETTSDFALITTDGGEIHVHRDVLAARSAVFKTMLETKMKENEHDTAQIFDIDGKTLMALLQFVYSGKVESFDKVAILLLYAAHKYEVNDLKPLCVRHVCQNLNKSNVLDTLLMANLISEDKLKAFCFFYMKLHYETFETDEIWKEVPVKLYKEMLDYLVYSSRESKDVYTVASAIDYADPASEIEVN